MSTEKITAITDPVENAKFAAEIVERRRRGDAVALPSGLGQKLEQPRLTIAVFLAESPWGDIDASAMGKGLGGRETALVQLSMAWAAQGHDVYAFVPRSTTEIIEHGTSGGLVRWIPCDQVALVTHAVQPDLFISWENAEVFWELPDFVGISAIEMQVAHLNSRAPVGDLVDYMCVLSEWAGDFIKKKHPSLDKEQVVVFANGVDLSRFEDLPEKTWPMPGSDDKYHFVYSSSPDRGLHHLLKMWPDIQANVMSEYGVESELHVCYGIENFIAGRMSQREDGRRAIAISQLINQPGVNYHGKVGQDELAQIIAKSHLMLYPADTMSPTETGCISIVEALAAGTPVVTTDCDCIGPDYNAVTVQVPLPFLDPPPAFGNYPGSSYKEYIVKVLDALEPEDYQARVEVGLEFAPQRDWDFIARQWIDFFAPKVAGNNA